MQAKRSPALFRLTLVGQGRYDRHV